jgi:hypothetical protein
VAESLEALGSRPTPSILITIIIQLIKIGGYYLKAISKGFVWGWILVTDLLSCNSYAIQFPHLRCAV